LAIIVRIEVGFIGQGFAIVIEKLDPERLG
jgi:hypothetical protein